MESIVGREVTLGTPAKTGRIMAFVPAGASLSGLARALCLPPQCKAEEDTSRNPRYIVRVARGKVWKWYGPRADVIRAAVGAVVTDPQLMQVAS